MNKYLYTVKLRTKSGWTQKHVMASTIQDVAVQLKAKLDDIIYETKKLLRESVKESA